MQDRYVGDIGDFGKYALLNFIREKSGLSLGVVWYLVDPNHTDGNHQVNDGKHINYLGLSKPHLEGRKLKKCAPDLFEQLKNIVASNQRTVLSIREKVILGKDVKFFEEIISCEKGSKPEIRKKHREDWLKKALNVINENQIVFLDPDNGFAISDRDGSAADDPKFVLLDELKRFWDEGLRIVILYHHPNRKDKGIDHNTQIKKLTEIFEKELVNSRVLPLRYRRGTSRVYFVVVPNRSSEDWEKWLCEFSKKPWPVSKSAGKAFESKFSSCK